MLESYIMGRMIFEKVDLSQAKGEKIKKMGGVLSFVSEMQRIAFRLMLSSCVCLCVCLCLCVCAAFVDAKKTV